VYVVGCMLYVVLKPLTSISKLPATPRNRGSPGSGTRVSGQRTGGTESQPRIDSGVDSALTSADPLLAYYSTLAYAGLMPRTSHLRRCVSST
jgi:hypothetical protein